MAKPKQWRLDPKLLPQLESLAGYGLNKERIANFFGVSLQTFEHAEKKDAAMCNAILKGRSVAGASVAKCAFEMAMSKKHPAMTIFWMKVRERWSQPKEHTVIEHKGIPTPDSLSANALALVSELKLLLHEPEPTSTGATLATGLIKKHGTDTQT